MSNRAAHIAVGVDMDGRLARGLGIWAPGRRGRLAEGAACVRPGRHDRGVADVLIVEGAPPAWERSAAGECDGLTGLAEAVEATWPDSMVPTCVGSTPVRASMRFVAYQDREKVAAARGPVYTAASENVALSALADFADQWGSKYPDTVTAAWQRAWDRNTAVPGVPAGPAPGHLSPTSWEAPPRPTASSRPATSCARCPRTGVTSPPTPPPSSCCGRHVCNTRGPPSARVRQGDRPARRQAQGQAPPHRRPDHHQLEAGPRPAGRSLPRPHNPLPLNQPAYTENLTGSWNQTLHRTRNDPASLEFSSSGC